MPRRTAIAALVAALSGCGAFDSVPAGAVTECQVETLVPGAVKTDILFVVDDSGSMAAEQANLATSFDSFIRALAGSAVKDDFQIGVTTSSVDYPRCGDASCSSFSIITNYTAGPASGTPFAAGALVGAAGHQVLPATSATLIDDFKANVNVGTSGSPKEQGLRAALLAVTDRIADGTNAGFLRPGARLAVIVVTDEDDCSDPATPPAVVYPVFGDSCHADEEKAKLPPVADYVNALKANLAGEARDVVLAVIAAVDPTTKEPVQPACNPQGDKATRYSAFVSGFPGKGLIDDICQADFTATLQQVAGLIASQTLPLSQTPADPALLTVSMARASDGTTTSCNVVASDGDTATADVVYSPPREGRQPELTFQRGCALAPGDEVHVQVLCAR